MLEERFALIECCGVLHHLDDPMAGWAVLRRLLRPDGLMLIALYSELARTAIVAMRDLVAEHGLPADPRRYPRCPSPDPGSAARTPGRRLGWSVTGTLYDFYSISGFRDLAMHVQEHRFTIPRIADRSTSLG